MNDDKAFQIVLIVGTLLLLPIMVYHQLQLILCTFLARRYAVRAG